LPRSAASGHSGSAADISSAVAPNRQTRTNQTTSVSIHEIKKIKKPRIYHTFQTLLGPMHSMSKSTRSLFGVEIVKGFGTGFGTCCSMHTPFPETSDSYHVHTEIQGIFCAALCKFVGSA
jgi:hypothetical protein